MRTPSCSSTPIHDHLDLFLPPPCTAFSRYPNVMNHNICTYQSTSGMSKTQMIGVQIKLGAEVGWSKGTRLVKRMFPDTSLELSGWIGSLPWKDLIEKMTLHYENQERRQGYSKRLRIISMSNIIIYRTMDLMRVMRVVSQPGVTLDHTWNVF